MVNYIPMLFIILMFTCNYLVLYNKNRIIHDVLFIAISISSLYLCTLNETYQDYAVFSIILIVIGVISIVYSTFVKGSPVQG